MPERFLVFIPAYNCEKQVPRVLNQLLDCQVAAMVTECIVVNNRSTDGFTDLKYMYIRTCIPMSKLHESCLFSSWRVGLRGMVSDHLPQTY